MTFAEVEDSGLRLPQNNEQPLQQNRPVQVSAAQEAGWMDEMSALETVVLVNATIGRALTAISV
jgi:hypothetical protein